MSGRLFTRTTTFVAMDDMQAVVVHDTPIVKWNEELIILDTGGFGTRLTKNKMNQTARDFDLDFRVYQEKSEWYVVRWHEWAPTLWAWDWDNPIPFVTDTLALTRRYER